MQQDNPQQAAAYVAGFLDGEGTIRVQFMKSRGPAQYVPQVKATSVTREVLDYVQSIYGGWIGEYQPQSPNQGNTRRAFQWTLQGRDSVLKLMRDMEPYCITKEVHVALMIEFITEGEQTHPPYPVSQEEIERRRMCFEQFGELNRRGVQLQRLSASALEDPQEMRQSDLQG
jgi:hypothetical protein